MPVSTTRVLLVDDNLADRELVQSCIDELGKDLEVISARDGEEALDLLASADELPALVLLDLNLPKSSGREVLRSIRSDARTAAIVVVVLTSSSSDRDIRDAYAGGANVYVVKPMDLAGMRRRIAAIVEMFVELAATPRGPAPDQPRRP